MDEKWDPSVTFIILSAVLANLIGLNLIKYKLRNKHKFIISLPQNYIKTIGTADWKAIVGSAIFGVGFGIIGVNSGPEMINLYIFPQVVFFIPSIAYGQLVDKTHSQSDMSSKIKVD